MPWSKDFTAVTLSADGTDLLVEGDSRAANDIDDADVRQLHVAIVAAPDGDELLWSRVSIGSAGQPGLVSPWQATFKDVPAPFNEQHQCLHLIGIGLVDGVDEAFIWTQRKSVLLKSEKKPQPGSDC